MSDKKVRNLPEFEALIYLRLTSFTSATRTINCLLDSGEVLELGNAACTRWLARADVCFGYGSGM